MGIGSRNVLINKPLLMNTLVQAFLIEHMKARKGFIESLNLHFHKSSLSVSCSFYLTILILLIKKLEGLNIFHKRSNLPVIVYLLEYFSSQYLHL